MWSSAAPAALPWPRPKLIEKSNCKLQCYVATMLKCHHEMKENTARVPKSMYQTACTKPFSPKNTRKYQIAHTKWWTSSQNRTLRTSKTPWPPLLEPSRPSSWRFWLHFGPKRCPRSATDPPTCSKEVPKGSQRAPQILPKSIFGALWAPPKNIL